MRNKEGRALRTWHDGHERRVFEWQQTLGCDGPLTRVRIYFDGTTRRPSGCRMVGRNQGVDRLGDGGPGVCETHRPTMSVGAVLATDGADRDPRAAQRLVR